VYVYYVLADHPLYIDQDGEHAFKTTDYAKVQRAQRLFPEAVIVATFIMRHDPTTLSEVKGIISE